jgi:hypothetical protein
MRAERSCSMPDCLLRTKPAIVGGQNGGLLAMSERLDRNERLKEKRDDGERAGKAKPPPSMWWKKRKKLPRLS